MAVPTNQAARQSLVDCCQRLAANNIAAKLSVVGTPGGGGPSHFISLNPIRTGKPGSTVLERTALITPEH